MKNCLFWGNAGSDIGAGDPGNPPIATYCGFDSNQSAQSFYSTGCISTLTAGNTFITPTTFRGVASTEGQKTESANANWNLKAASPAINVGTDLSASPIFLTTDILGNPRPLGTAFDMGAYERSSTPTEIKPIKSTMYCYSEQSSIELRGLTIGESVLVYGISGNSIYNQKALNSSISISVPQGIYLVRATDKVNKVIVR